MPASAPETLSPPTLGGGACTSLACTLRSIRAKAWQHALIVGLLCLGIALILAMVDPGSFATKLTYSLCIGFVCTSIVNLTRLADAAFQDLLRRRRHLPPSGQDGGWRGALVGAVMAMLLGPLLGLLLGDALTGRQSADLLNLDHPGSRLTLMFGVLGTVVSVALIGAFESLSTARAQAEAAQRLAAENQLRLLQSQLQPHMLFNTLANLRVLIGLDAERAQQMLDHLIHFLRATLNASRTTEHPLSTEFDRLADYLALMAVRMGDRLQVRLDLPAELRGLPVPPLLLQPLVENAIQHGLEPHVQGGRIDVTACAEGGMLVLSVRDTGVGLPAEPAAALPRIGFGLSQIRERLATLHGGAASLTLQPAADDGSGTRATIRLPMAVPLASPRPGPASA